MVSAAQRLWVLLLLSFAAEAAANESNNAIRVFPGDDIQKAIDTAARGVSNKVVRVHAGTYVPKRKGQALIHLNRQHDGVIMEAVGTVILSAANPQLADRNAASFPAIVNHVVYFGDGISRATVLRSFKITGANNFVTDQPSPEAIEPNIAYFDKTAGYYGRLFFFTDGGGLKILGRSYPVIDQVEVYDNFSSPCGAGVSIEHRGYAGGSVLLTNCIFRNNRCSATGSAVDLLPGSSVEIVNCLFIGNISNIHTNYVPVKGNAVWPELPRIIPTVFRYMPEHGCGALTVFAGSSAHVDRSTFTGNFNGIDARGFRGSFKNSILWKNNAQGGIRARGRYELNVEHGESIENCFINGDTCDLRGNIRPEKNQLNCEDPAFDAKFAPTNPLFRDVGYRPR